MTPILQKLIATAEKNNLEHSHQVVIFALFAEERAQGQYLETQWMFAIPNANSHHQVSEGVKAGVPDIALLVRRGGVLGLWVELKIPQSMKIGKRGNEIIDKRVGEVSQDQEKWHNHLQFIGYTVKVCYGWEDAVNTIKGYLG